MIISSHSNPRMKQIRLLRNRKERERTCLFFVKGIRLVAEAAQLHADIESLIVAPDLLRSPFAREIVKAQRQRGVACIEVTADVFRSISLYLPQGRSPGSRGRGTSTLGVIGRHPDG